MNVDKYLPIGSIVLLKGADKELMVIGYGIVPETENQMYDYLACLYPEGVISPDKNFLFNHEQIDRVIYLGYNTEKWKNFNPRLKETMLKIEKSLKE